MPAKVALKKKAITVSIDPALLAEAKAANLNVSGVLDDALRARLAAKWREENREAIESVNAYVEKHGLPLAKFRTL
jgi:antitoxin CcdA